MDGERTEPTEKEKAIMFEQEKLVLAEEQAVDFVPAQPHLQSSTLKKSCPEFNVISGEDDIYIYQRKSVKPLKQVNVRFNGCLLILRETMDHKWMIGKRKIDVGDHTVQRRITPKANRVNANDMFS